jgi:hypothetical protein
VLHQSGSPFFLETALQQRDTALKLAAASQREASEALSRARAEAQAAQREAADLRRRNAALKAAAAAKEAAESDALNELRRQVTLQLSRIYLLRNIHHTSTFRSQGGPKRTTNHCDVLGFLKYSGGSHSVQGVFERSGRGLLICLPGRRLPLRNCGWQRLSLRSKVSHASSPMHFSMAGMMSCTDQHWI